MRPFLALAGAVFCMLAVAPHDAAAGPIRDLCRRILGKDDRPPVVVVSPYYDPYVVRSQIYVPAERRPAERASRTTERWYPSDSAAPAAGARTITREYFEPVIRYERQTVATEVTRYHTVEVRDETGGLIDRYSKPVVEVVYRTVTVPVRELRRRTVTETIYPEEAAADEGAVPAPSAAPSAEPELRVPATTPPAKSTQPAAKPATATPAPETEKPKSNSPSRPRRGPSRVERDRVVRAASE